MKLSLIVPVYNEEKTIPIFYHDAKENLVKQAFDFEILFVNDGSVDNTEAILNELCQQDVQVKVIHFTRNFGKEAALFAGLEHIDETIDAVIPIDVDLQDPIETIPLLVKKWESSKADSVLAKRVDRSSDSLAKRLSSKLFYKVYNQLSNNKIEENVGDFRLLSKGVVDRIIQLGDYELFMKGVYNIVGGTCAIVEYTREPRVKGVSNFSPFKLLGFAVGSLLSSSIFPLRIWLYLGVSLFFPSFFLLLVVFIKWLFTAHLMMSSTYLISDIIVMFSGVQLLSIGILGEYLWKIYNQSLNRPRYFKK
ncbi:glycosyltransferase family 2 protein [Celerinatantimonas yamalensis]|uniref:Glycosyltransferase family 2 protein n=1 Tax=Celerinatantimonas yamalensis TaxID=559956 RepID=A0ABW9GAY1_9GAMM